MPLWLIVTWTDIVLLAGVTALYFLAFNRGHTKGKREGFNESYQDDMNMKIERVLRSLDKKDG